MDDDGGMIRRRAQAETVGAWIFLVLLALASLDACTGWLR